MRMVDPIRTGLNGRPFLDYALIDAGWIGRDTRYVLQNPFGNSTPVWVVAEISHNNKWTITGTTQYGGQGGKGTKAAYVQGEGIIVQTGNYSVFDQSRSSCGGHGSSTNQITGINCRVHVWRVGA